MTHPHDPNNNLNPDPITDEPGAHPIGTGIGAAGGAVTGAAAGSVAGPIGTYFAQGYTYDDYAPAYRAGYQSVRDGIVDWNDARTDWERRWEAERAESRLGWTQAEPAVKAAWERANRSYKQTNQG